MLVVLLLPFGTADCGDGAAATVPLYGSKAQTKKMCQRESRGRDKVLGSCQEGGAGAGVGLGRCSEGVTRAFRPRKKRKPQHIAWGMCRALIR